MRFIVIAAVAGVGLMGGGIPLVASCGGAQPAPTRGVIENDVGEWSFRRYQSVLDVEVWVRDNSAVAHTASYAHKEAEKRGKLGERDVVNAFVTRYQSDIGVERALVQFARRLASESSYQVSEQEVDGVRLLEIRGSGEAWAMWPARAHVIKIGGRGLDAIPEALIGAYGERYPSRLHAGALDAPMPPPDTPRKGAKK